MNVVTRFAPSPTGLLHIGGVRTALFCWLYARRHHGKFILRVEDTDRERSTDEAVRVILDGMQWLGLDADEGPYFQTMRYDRYNAVLTQMLERGQAYRCYCTREELEALREQQLARKEKPRYDGRCRERTTPRPGVEPVIRFRSPTEGSVVVEDQVHGRVVFENAELDDLIIARSDGNPTYNFCVVVDDMDMGITHVIRGDDHLNNAFRQTQIYRALDWDVPEFAHVPLIHGADGAKLSKRHGALGVEAYRDMGYLPAALRNYLLRLGWGHGDDEIISTEQAIAWFDIDAVGRAPARFDFVKLDSLNGHYIRQTDDARLAALVAPRLEQALGQALDAAAHNRLVAGMAGLKTRAKTLNELAEGAKFYVAPRPLALDDKARRLVAESRDTLRDLRQALAATDWAAAALEEEVRRFAEARGLKLGAAAQPLRAALSGSTVSPPIFDVMATLGRDEALGRLDDAVATTN
jgi:glutamyl-tRNA synthetase